MSTLRVSPTSLLRPAPSGSPWRLRPLQEVLSEPARSVRVCALLAGALCMSVADLYMTLVFTMTVGMIESNPVARLVMALNSPALVVVWKLALTFFGVGVLFWHRRRRMSELASWVVFAAFLMLTIHWIAFTASVRELAGDYHMIALAGDPRWVDFSGR